MPKEILIDVSEYEAPQPFEEVIQLLSQMEAGEYIRMLHRKKPLPLLQFLQENGYAYKVGTAQRSFRHDRTEEKKTIEELSQKETLCENSSDDNILWEIIIWDKKDAFVKEYCLNTFY